MRGPTNFKLASKVVRCFKSFEVTGLAQRGEDGAGLCKEPNKCYRCYNSSIEIVEVLSEPCCFSCNYLVKNYLIMSQTKRDDFSVLKCYLISHRVVLQWGEPGEPQVRWGPRCCTGLRQTQQWPALKYVISFFLFSLVSSLYLKCKFCMLRWFFASSRFKLVRPLANSPHIHL